jgi:nicotinate-nucleotide pyrophosphorylase (carboxylating)
MIKDNHIDAAGSIKKAIEKANTYLNEKNLQLGITVEVRNLKELEEALDAGNITRIMLDNFDIDDIKKALKRIDGQYESEVSGGVRLNAVRHLAETGVDFISAGALTHSASSLDLSLKILK